MPKEFARSERVAQLILRNIALILARDVKDEKVSKLTVTDVEVTKDLRQAKIFVSSTSNEEQDIEPSMQALEKASGYIRRQLASNINMRHCPNLIFYYDSSLSNASKIDVLLAKALGKNN